MLLRLTSLNPTQARTNSAIKMNLRACVLMLQSYAYDDNVVFEVKSFISIDTLKYIKLYLTIFRKINQ